MTRVLFVNRLSRNYDGPVRLSGWVRPVGVAGAYRGISTPREGATARSATPPATKGTQDRRRPPAGS